MPHRLLGNNRTWAAAKKAADPGCFTRLATQQHPRYIWIGCAGVRAATRGIRVALATVLQDAWARGHPVAVHGGVYGLSDGLLKDLGVTMERPDTVVDVFSAAIKRYPRGPESGACSPTA
jgi:carbonic anhydrase